MTLTSLSPLAGDGGVLVLAGGLSVTTGVTASRNPSSLVMLDSGSSGSEVDCETSSSTSSSSSSISVGSSGATEEEEEYHLQETIIDEEEERNGRYSGVPEAQRGLEKMGTRNEDEENRARGNPAGHGGRAREEYEEAVEEEEEEVLIARVDRGGGGGSSDSLVRSSAKQQRPRGSYGGSDPWTCSGDAAAPPAACRDPDPAVAGPQGGGHRRGILTSSRGTVMQHKTSSTSSTAIVSGRCSASSTSPCSLPHQISSGTMSSQLQKQLRSVLKRQGQRSRGHRVSFNEAKNQFMEPDYVILFQGDGSEPQLVSIRSLEFGLPPPPAPPVLEGITLSPPDGYKDCFNRVMREMLPDDSDTESGADVWAGEVHAPNCPRSNLPDVVASQRTRLTVENVRHHDKMMDDDPLPLSARTGILKFGKLWKNGDASSRKVEVNEPSDDSQRRSVRFSGRDEYTMVDSSALDEHAALTRLITPKLRELGMLLGKDPWQLDLGSTASDPHLHHHHLDIPEPPPEPKSQPLDPSQLEDEHIGESMRRYEEMRRRLAVGEGRDGNSESSDESKSSNDSHSSDSTTTESRIRRLENADVAHVAGGILRSNSEVRRAIEQNALRRSLMKFPDARKKDTNKNDRSEKPESSILEKLKWLTASEDLTNGNSDDKIEENLEIREEKQEGAPSEVEVAQEEEVPHNPKLGSVTQYRQLAEMFNKSTAVRGSEHGVPGDIREWKLESDHYPHGFIVLEGLEEEIASSTKIYTAVPAVSVCDTGSDEEADKLLYSGGVRYTREGTLMPPRRKELCVNKILSKVSRYTLNDIDEALHDDRSSSVPSSSQSSPRLSGRSDVDGTSTTESGYSSNETNGEYNSASIDELAEFVRQDASRLERLRMRYNEGEDQDHGFGRRPAVKGIKPRYGSTNELIQQMANQVSAGKVASSSVSNAHMTWPYREPGQENSSAIARQRVNQNRTTQLPSVQEDMPFHSDDPCHEHIQCIPEACCHNDHTFSGNIHYISQGGNDPIQPGMSCVAGLQHDTYSGRPVRTVESYPSNIDERQDPRYGISHDSYSHSEADNTHQTRMTNQSAVPPPPHYGSTQSLQAGVPRPHHPSCMVRRPNSLHDQIPSDGQQGKQSRPTNLTGRPHSSLGQYSGSRYPDEALQSQGNQHQPLGARGSFPGTSTHLHSIHSPTQHSETPNSHRNDVGYQHPLPCAAQNKGNYSHSPKEQIPPNHSSPVSSGGISLISCYPRSQQPHQRLPNTNMHSRCYPPQWHPLSGSTVPVSTHLSYTTPMVPENTLTPQAKMHPDVQSKVDLLRDERGAPEGASSSPRSSYDSHYHSHGSPPCEQNLLLRHAPTLDISS